MTFVIDENYIKGKLMDFIVVCPADCLYYNK